MFIIADERKHHQLEILRTARIWQTVLIPCNFPTNVTVAWKYRRTYRSEVVHITTNGLIADEFQDRFQLEPNGLLVSDVQPSDAGWYTCHQKHTGRTRQIIRLSVPCK